jgi:hypothetical protein
MQLFAAVAVTLLHKIGPRAEIIATWTKVLELAERLDDTDYKMRALWGLWISSIDGGQYRAALEFAQRFRSLSAKAAGQSSTAATVQAAGRRKSAESVGTLQGLL